MIFSSRFIFLISFLLLFFYSGTSFSKTDSTHFSADYKIYFYNPESNINNFRSLKTAFDLYLSQFGAFQFQPFEQKKAFEKMLQSVPYGIFLLSSWQYKTLISQKNLTPVLIAVVDGKSVQKKVLIIKSLQPTFEMLKGKTVATSGDEAYSRNLLQEMFPQQPVSALSTIKLIFVPTDINALISLHYGMARAALSSESSFKKLQRINPKLSKQLSILGKSQQKLRTLVVVKQKGLALQEKIINVLLNMGKTKQGKEKLRLLGIDEWRPLNLLEHKQLIFGEEGVP